MAEGREIQCGSFQHDSNGRQCTSGYFALIFGTIADATGRRKDTANVASVLTPMTNIMLAIWYIPKSAFWFAFFFSFIANSVQPVIIVSPNSLLQVL
jgi:ACS family pantothenate transporter-like MFS transporter